MRRGRRAPSARRPGRRVSGWTPEQQKPNKACGLEGRSQAADKEEECGSQDPRGELRSGRCGFEVPGGLKKLSHPQ